MVKEQKDKSTYPTAKQDFNHFVLYHLRVKQQSPLLGQVQGFLFHFNLDISKLNLLSLTHNI